MKKVLISFLFLFFVFQTLYGQNNVPGTKQIAKMPAGLPQLNALNTWANDAFSTLTPGAAGIIQSCREYFNNTGDNYHLARLNLVESTLYLNTGDTVAALKSIDRAEKYAGAVDGQNKLAVLWAGLSEKYFSAGNRENGNHYLKLIERGSRGTVKYSEENLAALLSKASLYTSLKKSAPLDEVYQDAIKTAQSSGNKDVVYQTKDFFAVKFFEADKPGQAFSLLDALVSDTGLNVQQKKHVYCRLIINSVLLQRLGHLNEYYRALLKLSSFVQTKPFDAELVLATAMYKENTNQKLRAEIDYLKLADDYRQNGPSELNMIGMINLAAFYAKHLQTQKAGQYFDILKKEITGPLLKQPVGYMYLNALSVSKNSSYKLANGLNENKLLKQDSVYKAELQASTRELEYQFNLIKSRQHTQLLQQQKKLQQFKFDKQQQQYRLYMLLLFIFLLFAGAAAVFINQRRKHQAKQHVLEMKRKEAEHQAEIVRQLTTAQEEERGNIAEKLHDEIGSMLSIARLNLSVADDDHQGLMQISASQIKAANTILAKIATATREMSHQLMPPGLKHMGLQVAIREFINDINVSGKVKVECIFIDIDENAYPDDLKVNIYRMVQELFQNILKHAHARKVFFQMVQHDDGLNIMIEDDGVGINGQSKGEGKGLSLLYKRVAYYDGNINIEPGDGAGTLVIIDIPAKII